MKHASLFSGIGGFDLASEWMGWTNVFNCEIEKFPQQILNYYWPNAIQYDDIKQTDFTIHRGQIDILTGGFPCQPFSSAGKRKGKEDDRHLWPEMLRAIREIQPTWIVGENVRGLLNWSKGLVFEEVQADLEAEGYEVQPFLLPACSVDAPHRRDRIWIVAYRVGNGSKLSQESKKIHDRRIQKGLEKRYEFDALYGNGITPNTNSKLLQRRSNQDRPKKTKRHISSSFCRNPWENFPTQSPICERDDGFPPELDGITFPKWRNESIKGAGNAVVPQVVYQIFKTIDQMSI